MQVTITLAGLAAIFGMLAIVAGFAIWVIKSIVKEVVSEAVKEINGRYVYAKGSEITGHEIEGRLNKAEAILGMLQTSGITVNKISNV